MQIENKLHRRTDLKVAVSRAEGGILNAKSEFCWASLWFSQLGKCKTHLARVD